AERRALARRRVGPPRPRADAGPAAMRRPAPDSWFCGRDRGGMRAASFDASGSPSRKRAQGHQGRTMKKKIAVAWLAAALLAATAAWAEDKAADVTDMQALRTAVRADKRALVASTLNLTAAEAKKFWPVYDNYQRDVDMFNRRRVVAVEGLLARDKPQSELYARTLVNELIVVDEGEIKARRKLHNRLMRGVPSRILPVKKAARYLQLESKIRAVQAYDVASTIPLIK
ncbi:MAG: hypothetical protein ACREET_01895, partial [Stellaceae bacterium]